MVVGKTWIKLCAFSSIERSQKRSRIMRFQQIRKVKHSIFPEMRSETVRFGDNNAFAKM
jgi:hypothetical protein